MATEILVNDGGAPARIMNLGNAGADILSAVISSMGALGGSTSGVLGVPPSCIFFTIPPFAISRAIS